MWENSKIFHWYDSNNSYFLSILSSFFQLYSLIISFLESSWYHLLLMLLGNASWLHGDLSLSSKFYISKCMCKRLFFWLAHLKNVNHAICWYIISSIRMLLCSQYFLFLSIFLFHLMLVPSHQNHWQGYKAPRDVFKEKQVFMILWYILNLFLEKYVNQYCKDQA